MAVMMQKGEVREIGIEVTSPTNDTFTIDLADYKVYDMQDKERIVSLQEGGCEIQGRRIHLLFSATQKGHFVAEITYRILPEILKADVIVMVK